jgi:hypothetical protein
MDARQTASQFNILDSLHVSHKVIHTDSREVAELKARGFSIARENPESIHIQSCHTRTS